MANFKYALEILEAEKQKLQARPIGELTKEDIDKIEDINRALYTIEEEMK